MKLGIRVVLVAGLLLVGSLAPVVLAQTPSGDATIEDVTYAGQGDVSVAGAGLFLWQSETHQFDVVIATGAAIESAEVCLVGDDGTDGGRELACQSASLAADSVETVTVTVPEWPLNLTGEQTLAVEVRNGTGQVVAEDQLTVTVIRKTGDRDADGLSNEREATLGTSILRADTDDDGLTDRFEVETYQTDPLKPDTDGDGLDDGDEIRTHQTDPRRADTDDDGLDDGDEIRTHGTNPNRADTDGDRLTDHAEVNRYQTDPTAVDTDGDGLGDGTEVKDRNSNPTNPDTDDDGIPDGRESSVFGTDPTREDTDGDGLNDTAEANTYQTDPTAEDTDGDGLDDGSEVLTHGTNPNARDTDSDGLTDAAELGRGTDPTAPTAASREGVLQRTAAFASRRVGLLLTGSVVVLAAVAAGLYWSDTDLRRSIGWLGDVGTGSGAEPGTEQHPPDTGTDTTGTDGVGSAVLTNEERVQRLLEANGGRMLQSDVVEAADWSKATVSRVLSEMEANGAVTRIDVGKGNLVARPGDEPDNSDAPFSDQ